MAGRIDEFSIWSVALNAEDIAALAAGAPAWGSQRHRHDGVE